MVTLAFRVSEEVRECINGIAEKNEIPQGKLMQGLCEQVYSGEFFFNGEKFTMVDENSEKNIKKVDEKTLNFSQNGVDLTSLMQIASERRVTPQSLLDAALRAYR